MNYKGGLNSDVCDLCSKKEWIIFKDKEHMCDDCYRYIYTHPLDATD